MMLIKNIYALRSLPRLPLPVTCMLALHKAKIPYYPISSGYKKSKNDRAKKLSQLRCSVVGGWWLAAVGSRQGWLCSHDECICRQHDINLVSFGVTVATSRSLWTDDVSTSWQSWRILWLSSQFFVVMVL